MTKITLDRAVVQQALEALRCVDLQSLVPDYGSGHYSVARLDGPQVKSAITAMEAALAEPETCTWQQDGDSDSGSYGTSCRRYFNLEDGTPEDNKMAWCCYCGRKLTQALITEDEDD